MVRKTLAAFGILALIGAFLVFQVPRLFSELRHAKDFVPAYSWNVTDYKCTNWNAVMFNECTVSYKSPDTREAHQFTDWRFGRAPREGVMLMQRRGNMATVTTDLSMRTFWNRLALAITVLGVGMLALIGLAASTKKVLDEPVAAPGLDRRPGTFA